MKKLVAILSIGICSVFLLGGCETEEKADSKFVKLTIHDLSQTYHGNTQSPIDLNPKVALPKQHELEIYINSTINALKWNGHTIELKIENDSYIKSHNYDHSYEFKQLHFHTPSEHDINNVAGVMELHLVSALTNEKTGVTHYLVFGFIFMEGAENKLIQGIIDNLPDELTNFNHDIQHEELIVDLSKSPISLNDLYGTPIEKRMLEFYYYNGSLTTPPYTETVEWYVSKDYIQMSHEQLEIMEGLMGDNSRVDQQKAFITHGFEINI